MKSTEYKTKSQKSYFSQKSPSFEMSRHEVPPKIQENVNCDWMAIYLNDPSIKEMDSLNHFDDFKEHYGYESWQDKPKFIEYSSQLPSGTDVKPDPNLISDPNSEENDPKAGNSGQFSNVEIKSADSEYEKRVIGPKSDMTSYTNLCSEPCDPMMALCVVEQSEPDSFMNMNGSKHVNENYPMGEP